MSTKMKQKVTVEKSKDRGLPSECKELLSSDPQLISSNEALPSENPTESSNLSEFLCDSIENHSAIEDHKIIDTSVSDSSSDLISFKNLEQRTHAIPTTDHLQQNQSNSLKMFRPNLPTNVLSEDEHILREIRNIFESEGKLKDFASQTVDKDIFQNLDDQNCYDWNKFVNAWEGMCVIPDSTSEGQHHETIEEPEESLPTNKRPHAAKSPETITSSSKFSSFDEDHGSNQSIDSCSFEKESEMIVQPVSTDISKADSNSKFEEDKIPPFIKKCIALMPENFPNKTNDSLFDDSDDFPHVRLKVLVDLLENQIHIDEISVKTEELTIVEGDPSVFDNDTTKMVS